MSDRAKAFTLVELLIVIAVVCVLIAILLPALSKAVSYARNLRCVAQLQQMGAATEEYVNENRGYLFPNCYFVDGALVTTVKDVLSTYIPSQDKKTTIWVCPDAPTDVTQQYPLEYACNISVHPSYIYTTATNTATAGVDSAGHIYGTLRKMTAMRRPSELTTIADCSLSSGAWTCTGAFDYTYGNYPGMYNITQAAKPISGSGGFPGWDNTDVGDYHVRYRHLDNNSTNCLFLDGHVESFIYRSLLYKNFATGY